MHICLSAMSRISLTGKYKQLLHSLPSLGMKIRASLKDEVLIRSKLFIWLQVLAHWLDFMAL